MEENKLTIKLTGDQQTEIKNATGKIVAELNIELGATGHVTAEDLDQVSGGTPLPCIQWNHNQTSAG